MTKARTSATSRASPYSRISDFLEDFCSNVLMDLPFS